MARKEEIPDYFIDKFGIKIFLADEQFPKYQEYFWTVYQIKNSAK